jgi:hypothetical protein
VEHDIQVASLERFAAGTASREEARAITRHLLRQCTICAQRLRCLLWPSAPRAAEVPAVGVRREGEGIAMRRSLSRSGYNRNESGRVYT